MMPRFITSRHIIIYDYLPLLRFRYATRFHLFCHGQAFALRHYFFFFFFFFRHITRYAADDMFFTLMLPPMHYFTYFRC